MRPLVSSRLSPVRITALYAVAAALWVLAVDGLLKILGLQTINGWLFVGITAALLYLLLRHNDAMLARSEQRLREQHALFEAVIEGTTDAVFIKDAQGRYLLMNAAGARIFDRTPAEVVGCTDPDIFAPSTARQLREEDHQVMTLGEPHDFDSHTITASGRRHVFSTTKAPYRDADGRVAGVIGIARDVTERRQLEDAYRRDKEFLQTLIDHLPVMMVLFDAEGRLQWINREVERVLGWSLEEARRIDLLAACYPDPNERREVIRFIQEAQGGWAEFHTRTRDGRVLNTAWTTVRLSDGSRLGIGQDLTERRRMQEAVLDSEERLRFALEAARVGTWDWNILTGEVQWSEILQEIHGLSPGSFGGTLASVLQEVHPDDRQRATEAIGRAIDSGEAYHVEYRRIGPNGAVRWLEGKGGVRYDAIGRPVRMTGICMDVTTRKEIEEALRLSEERFRIALKSTSIVVFHQDRELRHTWIYNPQGKASEEILGRPPGESLERPEDTARLEAIKRRVLETGTGELQEIELRVDGTDRYYRLAVEPLRDSSGRVEGITCSAIDITPYKQLEARLRQQAQQLAELDRRKNEFLAMLAHELRNPLAPIRNAVEVLGLQESLDGTVRWARDVIDRQLTHLVHLVDDLLDVARITRGRIELRQQPVDLSDIVARAVEATRPLIDARRHRLTLALPDEPVRLEADPDRLVQIVANLLNNAAKYTGEGGEIRLGVQREAGRIVLRVRDTGMGIPAEALPHVFDLFVQTAPSLDRPQGGLGLGLALVRRLVQMHGGRVQAFSAGPGQGSEFVVHLPALAETPPSDTEAKSPHGPANHQETVQRILVVEDNKDVARSLARLLRALGQDVRMVHDGPAALEAVRDFRPALVLLDIGLPGMDGYEVARRLREEHRTGPRLAALTGYGREEDRQCATAAGFDHHLLKPVTLDELRRVLAATMASKEK